MVVELLDFKATDGVILNGYITQNHSSKVIIATHGMGSNCFKNRERIIAQKVSENGIDFLCFNNRGSELLKTVRKEVDGKIIKIPAGTSCEDVLEGYYDIKGAIIKAIELGYKEIYLQGHSLGSTKTVYTYDKLRQEQDEVFKYIKGMILLSLIDIPRATSVFLQEHFQQYLEFAEEKEKENKLYEFMPKESFIHPITVKTFLKYAKDYEAFNFAQYHNENTEFPELNAISIPLFMRWGNVNEMIEQPAETLTNMLNMKIKNPNKDITFIDGADHGYTGKEEVLAKQILNFIERNVK